MTQRSEGLSELNDHGYIDLNPSDAEELGICDGDTVEITSTARVGVRRGTRRPRERPKARRRVHAVPLRGRSREQGHERRRARPLGEDPRTEGDRRAGGQAHLTRHRRSSTGAAATTAGAGRYLWYGSPRAMRNARYSCSSSTTRARLCGSVIGPSDSRSSARASTSAESPCDPPTTNATLLRPSSPSAESLLGERFARELPAPDLQRDDVRAVGNRLEDVCALLGQGLRLAPAPRIAIGDLDHAHVRVGAQPLEVLVGCLSPEPLLETSDSDKRDPHPLLPVRVGAEHHVERPLRVTASDLDGEASRRSCARARPRRRPRRWRCRLPAIEMMMSPRWMPEISAGESG